MIKRILALGICALSFSCYGFKPNAWRELFLAIADNSAHKVSDLLDGNPPSIIHETIFSHTNDAEETHLEYAFRTRASFSVIRVLLDLDAPVNARTTVLHAAVETGNLQAADYVLSHGFNVDARNTANETPLDRALTLNSRAPVFLLLSYTAEIPQYNSDSLVVSRIIQHLTPLEQRVVFGSPHEVSDYLETVEGHADWAGVPQETLDRALLLAIGRGSAEKVKILLARNPSRNRALRLVRGILSRITGTHQLASSPYFLTEFQKFKEILTILSPPEPVLQQPTRSSRTAYPVLGPRIALRTVHGREIARPEPLLTINRMPGSSSSASAGLGAPEQLTESSYQVPFSHESEERPYETINIDMRGRGPEAPMHIHDLRYLPRASGEGIDPLHRFDLNYLPRLVGESHAQVSQNQSQTPHVVAVSSIGLIRHRMGFLLSRSRPRFHDSTLVRPPSDIITRLRTEIPTEQLIFVDDEPFPGNQVRPVASSDMARFVAEQSAQPASHRYGLPSIPEWEAANVARAFLTEHADDHQTVPEEFHAPEVTPYEHAVQHNADQIPRMWPHMFLRQFSRP